MDLLKRAGEGELKHDEYYWIDESYCYVPFFAYWEAIRLYDGDLEGYYYYAHPQNRALLKIDWLDE